ncbi:MAG: anthranilate synthase component I [Betaproteobacteria bacterium]|nr:anthranilate synthase component I [Betaproteobacteria bacterium]
MKRADFDRLAAAGHTLIPVMRETYADLETPLTVYLKLANRPDSFLLESVVGGERFGRYSIIGLPARERLVVRGHEVTRERDRKAVSTQTVDDPLQAVREHLAAVKAAPCEGPARFAGGLSGYFAYDIVRYVEKRLADSTPPDPLSLPDILLLVSHELAVFDNLRGKLSLIVWADPSQPDAFDTAQKRLDELTAQLDQAAHAPAAVSAPPVDAVREWPEAGFLQAVEAAQEYIRAVVLANRRRRPLKAHPLSLYRALRSINPSPYMFYYDFGEFQVVGASPEILVRLEDGMVNVRPIAGTRPRGTTPEEDHALAEDLLADPKERAEHVQLMDLGRNDVGRVAQTGSVRVTDHMVIERYSHVMHIVSNVQGQLKPGLDAIDALKATFPAGTLSGAPKVRAMQIIDEFEPSKRGVYGGAVGYLDYSGNMDVAIAIRTGVVKDGQLYVQAGAGIVADSVPQSEWQETENKARAVLRAAELAEHGPAEQPLAHGS